MTGDLLGQLHQRGSRDALFKESPDEPYLQKTAADSREPLNYEAWKVTAALPPKKSPAKSFLQILHSKVSNLKEADTILIQDIIRKKTWWKRAVKPINRYNWHQKIYYNEMDGNCEQMLANN